MRFLQPVELPVGRQINSRCTFDQSGKYLYQTARSVGNRGRFPLPTASPKKGRSASSLLSKATVYGVLQPISRRKCGTCHTFCREMKVKISDKLRFLKQHDLTRSFDHDIDQALGNYDHLYDLFAVGEFTDLCIHECQAFEFFVRGFR